MKAVACNTLHVRLCTRVPHIIISPITSCLQESVCQSQVTCLKNWWYNNSLCITCKTVRSQESGIKNYQYMTCKLLSQCSGVWTSLEKPVQLVLLYCNKWYIVLLGGHCQNSIHSFHCPIMVVAVLRVGLFMLALQSPSSIFSHASSFYHLIISSLSCCPLFDKYFIFLSSCHLVIIFYYIFIHLWGFVVFSTFCHFSSSHLFHHYFNFFHILTHLLSHH
jgi:hypothetical protein